MNSIGQKGQYFFACLFFASLNFEMFSPFMENLSISKIAMLLYIIVSLPAGLGRMFETHDIFNNLLAVLVMGLFMVLSSLANGCSKIIDISLLLNILMFWVLLNHYRRDDKLFSNGLIWFSISATLVAILFYLGIGVTVGDDSYNRLSIFNDNQNTVGIKMAAAILILTKYCLYNNEEKPIKKPLLLICIAPMLGLLFATASRTAFLIVALGFIVFIFLRPTKRNNTKLLWLAIGAFLLFVGYKIVLEQQTLVARLMQTAQEGSLAQRDEIWAMYLNIIKENPILGVGFSGGEATSMQVWGRVRSPHNVFIEVALYSGILGLIPFLVFVFKMYKDALFHVKCYKDLTPILLSIATLGMLLSGQALNVKLFWVIAAYAVSYQIKRTNTAIQTYE